MWGRNKINSVLETIYFISAPRVRTAVSQFYRNPPRQTLLHLCLFMAFENDVCRLRAIAMCTKMDAKNFEKETVWLWK